MPCICPNDLNSLVTVEKISPSATIDGSGNIDESLDSNWVVCGKEWVQFITKGSREFFRGQQMAEDISHQVTMRWSNRASGYTTGMRLRMDGRKFNIKAPPINVDEKNQWVVVATSETASV